MVNRLDFILTTENKLHANGSEGLVFGRNHSSKGQTQVAPLPSVLET